MHELDIKRIRREGVCAVGGCGVRQGGELHLNRRCIIIGMTYAQEGHKKIRQVKERLGKVRLGWVRSCWV